MSCLSKIVFDENELSTCKDKFSTYKDNLLKINGITETEFKNIGTKNMRNRKISLQDAAYYRFLYSEEGKTKLSITSSLNYFNKKPADRTSYERKENNIPLDYYKNLCTKIRQLYYDDFINDNCFKNENINVSELEKYTVVAVDGTYSNTNINIKKGELQTSLSMGYYDVTNAIPIDMNFEGSKKKNNEVSCLYDYID